VTAIDEDSCWEGRARMTRARSSNTGSGRMRGGWWCTRMRRARGFRRRERTDVEILRSRFRGRAWGEVEFRIPKSNPAVRERVTLMNARLESAAGERRLKVHPRCTELIQGFRAGDVQGEQAW